jgi:hypothetical protein
LSANDPLELTRSAEHKPLPARSTPEERAAKARRAYWMKTMIQWHWISSAICLIGMLLFTITGITLNHADEIAAEPKVVNANAELPEELRKLIADETESSEEAKPLPAELATWLSRQFSTPIGSRKAEWNTDEIYLSMPGPGVDAWVSIDRESGEVEFERTDRGWIAYFNDLHKGRNTGTMWKWFIDVFAVGTLIFCLTGLALLYLHGRHRAMTWPMVAIGLAIPALIAMMMAHFP